MGDKENDYLHCDIWRAIKSYNERHPELGRVEVLTALASVIGDDLALISGDPPGEMLALVRDQINERFWYRREQGQERRQH